MTPPTVRRFLLLYFPVETPGRYLSLVPDDIVRKVPSVPLQVPEGTGLSGTFPVVWVPEGTGLSETFPVVVFLPRPYRPRVPSPVPTPF